LVCQSQAKGKAINGKERGAKMEKPRGKMRTVSGGHKGGGRINVSP